MRHSWPPMLAVCLLGCQHPPAQTQSKTAPAMPNLTRSETVIDTPVGPTRRIEFKQTSSGELVRLELQHLTSGRLLLGQTALRVNEVGQWLLVSQGDSKTLTSFKSSTTVLNEACKAMSLPQGKSVLAAEFGNNNAIWRVDITRVYEQPKTQAGISTETEPAVDLVACKLAGL